MSPASASVGTVFTGSQYLLSVEWPSGGEGPRQSSCGLRAHCHRGFSCIVEGRWVLAGLPCSGP